MELSDQHPIFIGFKMDTGLRRELENLSGSDRKYVSREDPSFLLICTLGKDQYVGKLVEETLSTARVDDVCRNILSILQKLCPETRFPEHFEIRVCRRTPPEESAVPHGGGEQVQT